MMPIHEKYNSRAAALYREKIASESSGKGWKEPTSSGSSSGAASRAKADDDGWGDDGDWGPSKPAAKKKPSNSKPAAGGQLAALSRSMSGGGAFAGISSQGGASPSSSQQPNQSRDSSDSSSWGGWAAQGISSISSQANKLVEGVVDDRGRNGLSQSRSDPRAGQGYGERGALLPAHAPAAPSPVTAAKPLIDVRCACLQTHRPSSSRAARVLWRVRKHSMVRVPRPKTARVLQNRHQPRAPGAERAGAARVQSQLACYVGFSVAPVVDVSGGAQGRLGR